MSVAEWSRVFTAAYDTFNRLVDEGAEMPFDDYAATDPAEFFAVVTETFFLAPQVLVESLPEVFMGGWRGFVGRTRPGSG